MDPLLQKFSSTQLSLPDTQTQPTPRTQESICREIVDSVKPTWGRLYSTILQLKPVDLQKSSFVFGRAPDCDVQITESNFVRTMTANISKRHFEITRQIGQPVYITDFSKNGTFVNGRAIGHNNRMILQSDDQVAVSRKDMPVYIFKTMESEGNVYLPPELCNRYCVSKLLGTGAYGEVKLIYDKSTCTPYAVKKIQKRSSVNSSALHSLDNIRNEVRILKELSHPSIVQMQEIVETPEAVFIILEYMEGGELCNLVNSSVDGLSEATVKLVFYQIVLAVQYLHNKGITHRDLKPANVLLKSESNQTIVKVSDFGLSKIVNEESYMTTMCGTPNFLAPEVIDNRYQQYDQQVDVWSLGVILFYMISQEYPFKHADLKQLVKLIIAGNYSMKKEIWTKISKNANDLVKRMLTVNPKERITINEVVLHPWIEKDVEVQRQAMLLMSHNNVDKTSSGSTWASDQSNLENTSIHLAKRQRIE